MVAHTWYRRHDDCASQYGGLGGGSVQKKGVRCGVGGELCL
jgi:hypothetical protein